MRGFKDNTGSHSLIEGFFPSWCTQAPAVAGNESGKLEFRPWRGEIVPLCHRILKESLRHHHTDRVHAVISLSGVTISVTVKSRFRFEATRFQIPSQYVSGHGVSMNDFPAHASGAGVGCFRHWRPIEVQSGACCMRHRDEDSTIETLHSERRLAKQPAAFQSPIDG